MGSRPGGREERDEVGHAEQRDDDEERLGRLQVLVVLRLGVVRPQLAAHHLQRERGLSIRANASLRTPTRGDSHPFNLAAQMTWIKALK